MRVLLPARFDVLGCAMDSSIVSQWLALEAACDLVVWGPGLDGYQADMGLHEVAEYVDADVIMMPDLHQAISGLWDEMWVGVERCSRPIAWHFADHDSAVEIRRQAWQRLRPAAVISPCAEQNLGNYFDLRDQLGTRIFTVPWGYDAVQFHPPAEDAERDIDILVAGCEEPAHVYAVRGRVKQAARSLAGEFRVLDVGHPGYWESGGFVTGRGQAQYAQLLRRARLTTTGTAFNCAIARKFWESAGCGAVGVGDLPSDEPESERFRGVMLVIDPQWSVDRIVLELRQLLGDRESCELLSAGAPAAVSGCDHQERAREYVSVLEQIAETRQRKPRPFPAPAIRSPPRLRTPTGTARLHARGVGWPVLLGGRAAPESSSP